LIVSALVSVRPVAVLLSYPAREQDMSYRAIVDIDGELGAIRRAPAPSERLTATEPVPARAASASSRW
jgi:hypothetical protein